MSFRTCPPLRAKVLILFVRSLCSIILASMLAIRILMPVIKSILAPGPKARKVKSVAAKNAVTSKKASVSLKEKKAQ